MAGFANIGESGFQISPPLLSSQVGSSGYTNLSIPNRIRQYSPYFQPSQYQMPNQADTSGQHEMNVYMGQMGVGETGQQRQPGYADYGFSPEDWNNVMRYLSNPQSDQNMQAYGGITNRLRNVAATNPQFANWLPEQRQQFSTDFPIRVASGFGQVPAPILQNWGLPYPSSQTNNMRF